MKNTNRCKTIVITMLILLVFAMTGCQKKPSDVVATLDDKEITLGFANFYARYTQAGYDAMYIQYFGTGMWSQASGEETMEEATKKGVLETLKELYILDNRKEEYEVSITPEEMTTIETAADKFLEENSEDAIEEIGATREYVIEMLRLTTIQSKMHNAITADVDQTVTDEEKNQKTIKYIKVSTKTKKDENNKEVELTEEEVKTLREGVATLAKDIQEGADITTAATEAGYAATDASYGLDDESLSDGLKEVADGLKEGATSEVFELDESLYIVQLVSLLDEEATISKEQSIINERNSAKYSEIYDPWAESVTFTVKDKVWEEVKFDRIFTVISGEESATEAETATEETDGAAVETQEEITEDTTSEDTTEEAEESESDTKE